jgi:23S rRNA pseudouridine1911/1915/1917 synthase
VLSQRDKTGEDSIVEFVKDHLTKKGVQDVYAGLVHRIDRPVAGLLVIGKNKRATELISRLFKRDRVRKKYSAIVFGKLDKSKGELKHFLLERESETTLAFDKDPKDHKKYKEAVLEYEVVGSGQYHDIDAFDKAMSLVSVRLITGRKHQIRAQFSAIGHPIVGDSRYFTQKGPIKEKMLKCNFLPWGEIALCANYISFPHPLDNGKIIEVKTDLPDHWIKIY